MLKIIFKSITNPLNLAVVIAMFCFIHYMFASRGFWESIAIAGGYWFFSSLTMIMFERSQMKNDNN